MSRAFVKDDDDRPERPAARPAPSDRPNYVTASGLQRLRDGLEQARANGNDRDAEYFEGRLATAILREDAAQDPDVVTFGSTVTVRDEQGQNVRLRIVGEDEADPLHGTIGWSSPYATALLGRRVGERVVVQRPAGAAAVAIAAVERP